MKLPSSKIRDTMLWIVAICYFMPLAGVIGYSAQIFSDSKNWVFFSSGIFLTSVGAIILYLSLKRWESEIFIQDLSLKVMPSVSQEPVSAQIVFGDSSQEPSCEKESVDYALLIDQKETEYNQLHEKYLKSVEELNNLNQCLDTERELTQRGAKNIEELEYTKKANDQKIIQQKRLIEELHEVVAEQKGLIEKKQQQITLLDTKVNDLTYELKTLLQLAENRQETLFQEYENVDFVQSGDRDEALSDKQICTSVGASQQLKRCLEIAQKITGSNRFNGSVSSFFESPADKFTLDLRRLCESLRDENNCAIILYSPKEEIPLFANSQIKLLIGWSSEAFIQNFNEIFQDCFREWTEAIGNIGWKNEAQLKISLRTKNGVSIQVQAHLGLIPGGIFRNYAIAVLYSPF